MRIIILILTIICMLTNTCMADLSMIKAIIARKNAAGASWQLQDFTTFTEVDTEGVGAITDSNTITITNCDTDDTYYAYKDYTSIDDFHHRIQFETTENNGVFGYYYCGDETGSIGIIDAAGTASYCSVRDSGNGSLKWGVWESGAVVWYAPTGYSTSDDTRYYLDIGRSGSTVTFILDDDSDFSSPLTQTSVSGANTTYQYIQPALSRDSTGTNETSGVIENLEIYQ